MSIRVVQGLVDAVAMSGIDPQSFLALAKLDPSLLADGDVRLTRIEMFRLCDIALDLTGDSALGLHWGERFHEGTFTPLSHLIAHSMNLRAGLQTLFEYQRLMTDETRYELVEEGDIVTLRLSALPECSPRLRMFIIEMEAVGIYRLLRSFGANVRPTQFDFAYEAPVHRAEYHRVFSGMERFEQPYSALKFPLELMDSVPPHKDDDVRSALQTIAARRALRVKKSVPYALRVREQLIKLGPCVHTDMEEVAQALGMSVRSLRRKLDAEGATFNALAYEAAAAIAKDLLTLKNKSIKEAAFEMGFADVCGFHRAFKRWTGLTPRVYVEGHGGSQQFGSALKGPSRRQLRASSCLARVPNVNERTSVIATVASVDINNCA